MKLFSSLALYTFATKKKEKRKKIKKRVTFTKIGSWVKAFNNKD